MLDSARRIWSCVFNKERITARIPWRAADSGNQRGQLPLCKEATISQESSEERGAVPTARNKVYPSAQAALADLFDGAVVLIAGFAGRGCPEGLMGALGDRRLSNLTLVCQGTWPDTDGWSPGPGGIERLVASGQVSKLVSPMAFYPEHGGTVKDQWSSGNLEIEVVPQGILAERLRAGGAGLGGIFLPNGAGTRFAEGREVRPFGGRDHVFEPSLRADFALLRASAADSLGNLVYRDTNRNWNPVMAMAAKVCIVEVDEIFEPGGLDPEFVITPGIFVNRIVQTL